MKPKTAVQIIGVIISFAGLILISYSQRATIPYVGSFTIYPYQVVGAIVLLIGVVTIVIGYAIPEVEEPIATTTHPEFCCGKCPSYWTKECERMERNFNAVPCPKFYSKKQIQ